ncbi:putative amidohydrolase YtcJ [Mytilus trossulus]|uniref:putative amidohydrolase YtcJ n=1 Tax=Mytilus trossulus TaxID=6551 RepID=UPI003004B263
MASFKSSRQSSGGAIYINGNIYTVASSEWERQPKKAMVVQGGIIIYVGSDEEAKHFYKSGEYEMYDLDGATVLPGIHDVHMHPLESGSEVGGTCELPRDLSPEDMIGLIKKQAPKQKGTNWVLGHGYSIEMMLKHIESGGRSPRKILDEAVPNKPAIMMEETSHSVWVNTRALSLAGINSQTVDREGGIIMREKGTEEPNGILFENEGIEIMDIAMAPSAKLEKYNYEGLMYALDQIKKYGITSLCDARVYWKQEHHKAWQKACADKKLTVRAILGFWVYSHMCDEEQIENLKELHTGYHCDDNCLLRQNQIKMYADGLLDNTTAAVLKPYIKKLHLRGLEENIGMNYFTQARIEKYIKSLQHFSDEKQFDFHIHAIGDRAVHEVLNAIENTKENNTRHRMTHLELIDEGDLGRFKDLGVVADFQVSGDYTLPCERHSTESVVGRERAENFIAVKNVADTGATVTLSSDWDVSDLNPFIGIQHAVERGHQSVSIKQAIEMYTINGAYAMRQEHIVGSLENGKEADFVVIDSDVMKIPNSKISKIKIKMTVLRGDIIYRHKGKYPKSAKP